MNKQINQAVVFTKPVHHLGLPLTSDELAEQAKTFLSGKGLRVVLERTVSGSELAAREVIKQHYLMYSQAACTASADDLGVSDAAREKFKEAFGKSWEDEVAAGRIMGAPRLLAEKKISADELFILWNERFTTRKTQKIQDGLIMAWLDELDCYCINAFYPAMEENFNNPKTSMTYLVVEYDPEEVSWVQFRKNILGSTDASKADPESFRGQLYAVYGETLLYPGRDNFVHGSAGPVEGFIERSIHEPAFDMADNPIGQYFATRGITLESFKTWTSGRSITQLGDLFDSTEEKDTAEVISLLDDMAF